MDDINLIITLILSGIVIGGIIFISGIMREIVKEVKTLRLDIYKMACGLGLEEVSTKSEMDIELRELINSGKTSKAIKRYMEITGGNFAEAKRYIDYLKRR